MSKVINTVFILLLLWRLTNNLISTPFFQCNAIPIVNIIKYGTCMVFYGMASQRQYSVTQALTVNNRKIPAGITRYETTINGQPVYGGANDPRMGDIHSTSDPG